MIETRTAIAMRGRTLSNAKDVCEVCGKGGLLLVRTRPDFEYRKYMVTGKIEQKELCAVCRSCSDQMIARSMQDNGAFAYCSITASGHIIEYR